MTEDTRKLASAPQLWRLNSLGLLRLVDWPDEPLEEPLERLAELGREAGSAADPTRQFAEPATQSAAAPIRDAAVVKKAGEFSVAKSKKRVESRRRAPSYVWVSQASRGKRAAWADFVNQSF